MSKSNVATKEVTKEAPSLSAAQSKQIASLETVSAKIRYLNDEGYSRSEIARSLGKRYQHVRNVLITPVAKVKA